MKLAMPVCAGRIATVLDFAHELLVVELDRGHEISRSEVKLHEAKQLAGHGVHVLICGAISRSLAAVLAGEGIEIIPLVSGPFEDVLASYLDGQLTDADYLLPGCAPGAREEWRARHPGRRHYRLSSSRSSS
jgi:predicted Fe-Mo cluster-binding NifX family protein